MSAPFVSHAPYPSAVPMPAAVRWLGFGGLFPFFALLMGLALLGDQFRGILLFALVGYGAVVLTFAGALHWAFALTATDQPQARTRLLVWSVVPALCAWVALVLPAGFDLILLIVMFWVHFIVDLIWARRLGLPAWYLTLRTALTIGATLALTLAIALMLLNPGSAPDLMPAQTTCPAPANGTII